MDNRWMDWAAELQSLAQAGLFYSRDVFDIERFERIRDISAEILAEYAGMPIEKAKEIFCCESGYQTPKLDCRAAIFRDGKILLVHENDGRWSLPGGWMDVGLSPAENAVKEVREEAGLEVVPEVLIAAHDMKKHNLGGKPCPFSVCKMFFLCRETGGAFAENIETTESAYFALDELPALSEEKNSAEQIALCFEANRAGHWKTVFD